MRQTRTEKLVSLPHPTLFVLLVLALFLTAVMQIVGAPLTTAAAPAGIVSFEFARNLQRAAQILASWNEQARLHAALSLGLDYLYLLTYAPAIGIACLKVAAIWQDRLPWLARLGGWLGWGQAVAALCDAAENLALIRLLLGSTASLLPPLAWIAATIKFALVIAGLVYTLLGPVLHLLRPAADTVNP